MSGMKKILLVMGISMMAVLAGCVGKQGDVTEEPVDAVVSADEAGSDISENEISADENQNDETVSGNESPSGLGEMEVIELSNGLYAYVTMKASSDYAIEGITEWIIIQEWNPEEGYYVAAIDHSHRSVIIPNLYGTITDIRMDDYSEIYISYEDKEGENGQAVIPLDFYASEGNVIEPSIWEKGRILCFNAEELTDATVFPKEVWSETFTSGGEEYTAVYSRVSPMYISDIIEGSCFAADYQFAIRQGDETLYEIKLYQMNIRDEEVHYMEDVNGDGVEDFIQMNNPNFPIYYDGAYPYVFVWDQEQETCIYGGPIMTEEKASYDGVFGTASPEYTAVRYDRDTGIFYDFFDIVHYSYYRHDIHGMVILCGARFIDGEWKTVYELYLGGEGEDYAREIRYDEEGNVISEITCTEEEHYDLANAIYEECELELFEYDDYTREEIIVNPQFSYWKYVRIAE